MKWVRNTTHALLHELEQRGLRIVGGYLQEDGGARLNFNHVGNIEEFHTYFDLRRETRMVIENDFQVCDSHIYHIDPKMGNSTGKLLGS